MVELKEGLGFYSVGQGWDGFQGEGLEAWWGELGIGYQVLVRLWQLIEQLLSANCLL